METLGVFEDRKNVHVVSPLYAGGELFDAISSRGQHTFSERDAAAIVRQILEAVDHCHQQDVTHRDLKPENIMFKNDGSHYDLSSEQHADSAQNQASEMGDGFDDLVIVDFGMARYHRHSEPPMRSQVGSPSYVAPEVVRGLGYTRSCDIWSVGVIMYILLCGEPPFHGSNQSQTMRRIALMTDRPRQATVTALGEVVCLVLDRRLFKRVMGPMVSVLKRNSAVYNSFVQAIM
eukprot:g3051.t1